MTTTETLRECIERGGRGEFAKALLVTYEDADADNGFTRTYDNAWRIADSDNRERLQRAWEGGGLSWPDALCEEFPGLAHLDAPADEWPDLRGEQS